MGILKDMTGSSTTGLVVLAVICETCLVLTTLLKLSSEDVRKFIKD